MADAVVGIVANPLSGRDIRRLVAQASVFPTAEKAHMVQRMLTAFGVLGVERVLMGTDLGGISAAVLRATRSQRTIRDWPDVEFLDQDPITETAHDTTVAVRRMVTAGAKVIVCLGGDGTARIAAAACGTTPLLPLSTGTNNAFPRVREATVAGLAVGLVAVGAVDPATATRRAAMLEVRAGERTETALVDVCVSRSAHVGSRALWDPDLLTELYCAFAEPDGIGLSSVAGQVCPSRRDEPDGVALRLGPPDRAPWTVHAPIAPGLVRPVGVYDWRPLPPGQPQPVHTPQGVIALDGEREIEFGTGKTAGHATPTAGHATPTVRLRSDGPRCVDVSAVLAVAARDGLLRKRKESP